MIRPGFQFSRLVAVVMLLWCGGITDAAAQAGCFGDLFPAGALAGGGNVDGIQAGRAVSLLVNPAHTGWGGRWSAGGGYRPLYGMEKLQRVWMAGKYRRDMWGVGMTVTHFGERDFYTETEAAFCFGRRLRHNLAAGLGLTYMNLAYTPEMPSYTGWSLDAGMIYQPLENVMISGAARHLAQSGFIPDGGPARTYHVSAAFIVSPGIQLGVGWTRQRHDHDLVGLGQRLGLVKGLYFLSAVYLDPARYALGAEFILRGQAIFYTYLSHPDLGGTHYVEFEVGP
jgi:hypothetical protein